MSLGCFYFLVKFGAEWLFTLDDAGKAGWCRQSLETEGRQGAPRRRQRPSTSDPAR